MRAERVDERGQVPADVVELDLREAELGELRQPRGVPAGVSRDEHAVADVLRPPLCWDLHTVEQFDEAARHVRPEDVRAGVLVSADLARHAAWLAELAELGFAQIQLHHVGQDLRPFIDAFGARVLPELAA